MARHKNSRNKALAGSVSRYSRSAMYQKKALYKRKKVPAAAPAAAKATTKVKQIKGDKNGNTRVVSLQKEPGFYPVVDVPKKLANHKHSKTAKLRASITPGTILILLSGPYRGKRVVFLKQLPSGLLLVTGPFKINGVPLRRVNQAYVLATSQKLDVSKVALDEKYTDAFFKAPEQAKASKEAFLEKTEKAKVIRPEVKEAQKKVDSQLLPLIQAVPHLSAYLSTPFTLGHSQYPHLMKF